MTSGTELAGPKYALTSAFTSQGDSIPAFTICGFSMPFAETIHTFRH